MRWVPWVLGLAGVAQHALMAVLDPDGYVSLDMSYLVMWLSIIGALVVCYLSCWDCEGHGGGDCSCCGDHCHCGDCARCSQDHDHGPGNGHGHEGHSH